MTSGRQEEPTRAPFLQSKLWPPVGESQSASMEYEIINAELIRLYYNENNSKITFLERAVRLAIQREREREAPCLLYINKFNFSLSLRSHRQVGPPIGCVSSMSPVSGQELISSILVAANSLSSRRELAATGQYIN